MSFLFFYFYFYSNSFFKILFLIDTLKRKKRQQKPFLFTDPGQCQPRGEPSMREGRWHRGRRWQSPRLAPVIPKFQNTKIESGKQGRSFPWDAWRHSAQPQGGHLCSTVLFPWKDPAKLVLLSSFWQLLFGMAAFRNWCLKVLIPCRRCPCEKSCLLVSHNFQRDGGKENRICLSLCNKVL